MERFHRTLKADTANPPQEDMRKQQQAFDGFRAKYNGFRAKYNGFRAKYNGFRAKYNGFRAKYNEERPHEALGQEPPARHCQPSSRSYPSKPRSPEYGDEVIVRRVRSNGEIKWRGSKVYLREALIGELVGLIPKDGQHLGICFGPLQIGDMDTYTRKVLRPPIQVLPMSLV